MNPQNHLHDLFLQDTFKIADKEEWDALEFISRLRLYITVTNYQGTLRDLLSEHGFTGKSYDQLLQKYNRQFKSNP